MLLNTLYVWPTVEPANLLDVRRIIASFPYLFVVVCCMFRYKSTAQTRRGVSLDRQRWGRRHTGYILHWMLKKRTSSTRTEHTEESRAVAMTDVSGWFCLRWDSLCGYIWTRTWLSDQVTNGLLSIIPTPIPAPITGWSPWSRLPLRCLTVAKTMLYIFRIITFANSSACQRHGQNDGPLTVYNRVLQSSAGKSVQQCVDDTEPWWTSTRASVNVDEEVTVCRTVEDIVLLYKI